MMEKKKRTPNGSPAILILLVVWVGIALWLVFDPPKGHPPWHDAVNILVAVYGALGLGYHFRWWIEKKEKED